MGVFHKEPPNDPKRCKCIAATLKEIFAHRRRFGGRLSNASLEEDNPISNFDEEQQVIVSAVRSRAMEKQKLTPNLLRNSFPSWVYSPATRELYITGMAPQEMKSVNQQDGEKEKEEFLSVGSYFSCSCCSSAVSGEAFFSVKTNLSRSSSLNELDLSDYQWRRSVIQEFSHCEGWPFGLCRKAILLPPLPKSPSESWFWRTKQLSTKDS
ncbi:hypothetical protein L6164_015424 [Bauhinia variegata]|uniref:Uncharacterized protein n=1 Tax=Bauhinia variegata TaxID=167791 RepID=A0ACB9NKL0_BAUVA|nr:hypothetical protein L6164_015424 [Bauhinia variegata]